MKSLVALLNHLLSSAWGQALLGIWPARHKRLCAELIWRAHRDQCARRLWSRPSYRRTVQRLQQLIRLDLSNTRRLKQIIAQHGWPGRTVVGPIGGQAAWLLVQHADHDLAFQQRCLPLLEQAVQDQEASTSMWAYLTDRVRVKEGRPQVYGTQLDGMLQVLPMEEETRVDERRAEVGLLPLAESIEQMRGTQLRPWLEVRAEYEA